MPVRSGTRNAEEEENMEQWVVDIEMKYRSYDPGEYGQRKRRRCIYKWPNDLVAASSLSHHRAPCTVSLGPYHHGEEHLQHMEHHKERALHRILHKSKIPLSSFIQSLQDVEQELRDSYDNLDPKLSTHLFLRMMLFDGCFLLELLRFRDDSPDPFFGSDGSPLVVAIQQDMLILENQIPLLVLLKLLEVEEGNKMNSHQYLSQLVPNFYGFPFQVHLPCLHILDIYRECLIGNGEAWVEAETPISIRSHFQPWLHLSRKGLKHMLLAIPIFVFWLLSGRKPQHEHFRTASGLHEAGIEFKKGKPGSGLTISFHEENGVLTLPYIQLSNNSPIIYMNVMAFERMHPPLSGNKKVTDYIALMDQLIDTAEDVSLLCSQEVISNHLASDEDAAKLFNAFSDGLILGDMNTLELNKKWQHYAASDWNYATAYWNKAIASLRDKYFHNPWSVVSLLAALILLALTIIQTVFAAMQALNGGK